MPVQAIILDCDLLAQQLNQDVNFFSIAQLVLLVFAEDMLCTNS
jgi:hypothetical protein